MDFTTELMYDIAANATIPQTWDTLCYKIMSGDNDTTRLRRCRELCDFNPICIALTLEETNCTLYKGDSISLLPNGSQNIFVKICGEFCWIAPYIRPAYQ